jgi:hypothetical protein
MMTTVGDYRLGVQAWIGPSEPDPNKITVSPTEFPRDKPCDGFFTSTWNPARQSSPWLDDVRTNPDRNPTEEGRCVWTFQPDPAIRLRVIDSQDDYGDLTDEWPHRYSNERDTRCYPNWYKIWEQRPFDAVHVSAQAALVLEGWRVESTAWFALGRFTDLQRRVL